MFKERFIRLNAALLEDWFRSVADKLHELIPGNPVVGFILFQNGGLSMASIEVKDDSAPLSASVKFLDAEGHETTPDDVPSWTSSDESVVSLTVASDGLSAECAIGAPGVALVNVSTVESSTGATVQAQGTVTVTPGDTVMGEVSFAAPEPAPEPEPEPEG